MTKAITKNSKKGFTLVELVIVIAILAVLAAIAIPVVSSIINTASKNGALSNAQTIEAAIKKCQAEIATRNNEVYDGSSTYVKTDGSKGILPKASTNSTKPIVVEDVAGANSINNAFEFVTFNNKEYKPVWDTVNDKCVFLEDGTRIELESGMAYPVPNLDCVPLSDEVAGVLRISPAYISQL